MWLKSIWEEKTTATEVSLTSGHEKLTSFLWSHKDTKTSILGNAADGGVLTISKYLTSSTIPYRQMKNMGFTSEEPSSGANSEPKST